MKRKFLAFLIVSIMLLSELSVFQFVLSVKAQEQSNKWISRFASEVVNGNVHTATFSIGPQVFVNETGGWQELEFVENPSFASVAGCVYFARNSHVALEITSNSYVKFWNPDYTSVCVYSEMWTVQYWKGPKLDDWKDTGVGTQPNSFVVSQDSDCINITRIQSLVGVGQLNVTYVLRQGAMLKHNIVFQSYSATTYEYRVVMALAGITNSHVKCPDEMFTVTGDYHKVVPWFIVGANDTNIVLYEDLQSVYGSTLKDIDFNTHAQGIKADVIIGNYTLGLNGVLRIDPTTSTFNVVSDDYDGYVRNSGSVYLTVQTASTGSASYTTVITVGQSCIAGPVYYVYRPFIRFDTMLLPVNSTIDAAKICLGGGADSSTQDFVIRVQNWTEASDGISTADYDGFDGVNYDDGTFSTSSWIVNAYNNVTLSNFALIVMGGYTDVCLRSDRDISQTSPSVLEFVAIEDTGVGSYPALLEVTYTYTAPEYDYVDSQSNIDSVADKGTHSSFTAQKATDNVNDTLTEADQAPTMGDTENFVDSDTSDVDSHADHGTSSNFTAQQDSNILYNDTLTEAATTVGSNEAWTSPNGNVSNNWLTGANAYDESTSTAATHSVVKLDWSSYLWLNCSTIASCSKLEYYVAGASGSTFNPMEISLKNSTNTYLVYNNSFTASSWTNITFTAVTGVTAMRIRFYNAGTTTKIISVYEMDFLTDAVAYNYELDMEFQWTTVDYAQTSEYVCIHTGSTFNGAENILVKWRNGGSWTSLVTMTTANTWYNTSLAFASATLTLQFLGSSETSDTSQSAWMIECSLVHVWTQSVNYQLAIEEQFTNCNYTRANEELCIFMSPYSNSETISVQWWNTTSSSWLTINSSLVTNAWNNITVTAYLTSSTFTIQFIDGIQSGDTAQSTWAKDCCLLHTWEVTGPQEVSYSFTQTITPSATLIQWQEQFRNFTQTILFSGQMQSGAEWKVALQETVYSSGTLAYSQEQIYTYQQTIIPSASLLKWMNLMYGFPETITQITSMQHGGEAGFSFTQTIVSSETIGYWQEHGYTLQESIVHSVTLSYSVEGVEVFEVSFSFTQTISPTGTMQYWIESVCIFVQTVSGSETVTYLQEQFYPFQTVMVSSETVKYWQEQKYVLTETTIPTTALQYWIEGVQTFYETFAETLKPLVTLNYWMEMSHALTETSSSSTTHGYGAEALQILAETLTPSATTHYWQEQILQFSEATTPTAILTVLMELVETFIVNIETLHIETVTYTLIEEAPFMITLVLAIALVIIACVVTFAVANGRSKQMVATKKD